MLSQASAQCYNKTNGLGRGVSQPIFKIRRLRLTETRVQVHTLVRNKPKSSNFDPGLFLPLCPSSQPASKNPLLLHRQEAGHKRTEMQPGGPRMPTSSGCSVRGQLYT